MSVNNISTANVLLRIWVHLSIKRHIQLCLLLLIMFVGGGLEILSLGAVIPFLALISDSALLWDQPLIQHIATSLGYTHADQLLIPVTSIFVLASLISGLMRIANLWLNGRLAAALGSDLSSMAYERTLYQPYSVHVQRNSSSVVNSLTNYVGGTVASLRTTLQLINASITALAIFCALVLVDAPIALGSIALFSIIYLIVGRSARIELRSNSYKFVASTDKLLKAVNEGLGSIRDVILDSSQHTFLTIYSQADRSQRLLKAKNIFLTSYPRFVIEAFAMASISVLGVLLIIQRGDGSFVIPLLGALALGAQRLLPSLQQIYSGWASLRSSQASMLGVLEMLDQPLPFIHSKIEPLNFTDNILFKNLSFGYQSQPPFVINNLNLDIKCGQRIGLIGTTGSGKSTLVDLLMGLLVPTSGHISVDGINIHDPLYPQNLVAWRSTIAHVPQTIYLADSTIAENIAFGVPKHLIDIDRVKKAASLAQISSFIEDSNFGYDLLVGERGIRLSGGQRQRIGIARALYRNAQVLVFDEATSALDTDTEFLLMESVDSLSANLTIIMIAHRLTTLAKCDRLFVLDKEQLVEQNNYMN